MKEIHEALGSNLYLVKEHLANPGRQSDIGAMNVSPFS